MASRRSGSTLKMRPASDCGFCILRKSFLNTLPFPRTSGRNDTVLEDEEKGAVARCCRTLPPWLRIQRHWANERLPGRSNSLDVHCDRLKDAAGGRSVQIPHLLSGFSQPLRRHDKPSPGSSDRWGWRRSCPQDSVGGQGNPCQDSALMDGKTRWQ